MGDDAPTELRWRTRYGSQEIERRRLASLAAMEAIRDDEFSAWYQEWCDKLYWTRGQCCAGCDHWRSGMGKVGECTAASIVSGRDVLLSLGLRSCTYTPAPGFPYTEATFHCGQFRDGFDWSSLDGDYLSRIGAWRNGGLRNKPTHALAIPSWWSRIG